MNPNSTTEAQASRVTHREPREHDRAAVQLWLVWKQANDLTRAAVVSDVTQASEAVETELTVLIHLKNSAGRLRQNALGEATGWDRTRLSHVLTRMQTRSLISRHRLRNGVEVVLEPDGVTMIRNARPALAAAVERHVLNALTKTEVTQLTNLLHKIATHNLH